MLSGTKSRTNRVRAVCLKHDSSRWFAHYWSTLCKTWIGQQQTEHESWFSFSQSPWIPDPSTCSSLRQMLGAGPGGTASSHQEHADQRPCTAIEELICSLRSLDSVGFSALQLLFSPTTLHLLPASCFLHANVRCFSCLQIREKKEGWAVLNDDSEPGCWGHIFLEKWNDG